MFAILLSGTCCCTWGLQRVRHLHPCQRTRNKIFWYSYSVRTTFNIVGCGLPPSLETRPLAYRRKRLTLKMQK